MIVGKVSGSMKCTNGETKSEDYQRRTRKKYKKEGSEPLVGSSASAM